MKLALENAHPRDPYISFQDEGHIYTIIGMPKNHKPISVTTLVGKFWEKFDPVRVSGFVVRSRKMKDPSYQYYGMTQQEIVDLWSSNNAAQLGTDMHNKIELFYNDELPIEEYPQTKEFGFFLQFHRDFTAVNPDYRPYRTEWFVFDGIIEMNNKNLNDNVIKELNDNPYADVSDAEDLVQLMRNFMLTGKNTEGEGKEEDNDQEILEDMEEIIKNIYGIIAGSIDMTYINSAGQIVIVDWKRVKELDKCYRDKRGKEIFSHLQDTKFNHYSLQLNVYRHILETWYDKEIVGMYLAVFHPDNDHYIVREVKRMEKEVTDLWNTI